MECNSAARSSQAAAATDIGPDPGPVYIRAELISGGNSPKSIATHNLLPRPRRDRGLGRTTAGVLTAPILASHRDQIIDAGHQTGISVTCSTARSRWAESWSNPPTDANPVTRQKFSLLGGLILLELVGPDGLLNQLTIHVLETALDAEMTEHLGYEKHDPVGRGSGNRHNGTIKLCLRAHLRQEEATSARDRT